MTDRPTPTRRARPAADGDRDPADPTPPPDAASDTAATRAPTRPAEGRRGAEPIVQLNTRVSLDLRALVDDVAAETGRSVRDVIEHALRHTYGKR